jgi:hypothetical protein
MFKARHPLVENMFCTFDPDSVETLPVHAGRCVRLVGLTDDHRPIVDAVTDASAQTVFGILMQKVKETASGFPHGYLFRGDMGSSDAFLGDPVAVAHGAGAVYETDQYVDNGGDGIAVGTVLYCDDDGKLEDTNADSGASVAIAMDTLTATEAAAGKMLRIKTLV